MSKADKAMKKLLEKALSKEDKWVIMSKDRQWIAKGVPRNRCLVKMSDKKDKKRVLTYNSKGRAEAAFKYNWFYGGYSARLTKEDMEAVKVEIVMKEIPEK